jgi:NAD-dependent SIR2 family protein deacetylase
MTEQATDVPPAVFEPSGDGSYRVTCHDCKAKVPSDRAHVVKANNASGRAHRCEDCGQAAHAGVVAFNRGRRGRP